MTLGGDVASALPELRRHAESMMQTRCVVRRYSADEVFDEDTGKYARKVLETQYSGVCRIRFASNASPREVDAQSQLLVEQEPILHLPVSSSGAVTVGALVEVVANVQDPALVGLVFRISGRDVQTFATARRFPMTLVAEG